MSRKRAVTTATFKQEDSCCENPNHPKVGDRVAVIREEHGWHDGALEAKVKVVLHKPGTTGVSYVVEDDAGYQYVCPKRGDCRKINR